MNTADRFQSFPTNRDCGFHICYFIQAAIRNTRISKIREDFNIFQRRWNITFLQLNPPKEEEDTTQSQLTQSQLTQDTTTTSVQTIPNSTQSQPVEDTTTIVSHKDTEVQSPTQINPVTDD